MSTSGADGCGNQRQSEEIADGPQPMRNHRPSETTPNSADQFWQSHQAEYEARGKRSTDHVERVHRHNAAYPALRDELDRRRSISKVTAVKARRGLNLDYVCSECFIQRRNDLRKKAFKSRCHCKSNRQNKTKEKDHRSRCRRAIYRHKRYRLMNRGCQCGIPANNIKIRSKHSGKIYNLQSQLKNINRAKTIDNLEFDIATGEAKSTGHKYDIKEGSISLNENKSGSNVESLKNPSSTEVSVSSYNTFPSMDHEPMV